MTGSFSVVEILCAVGTLITCVVVYGLLVRSVTLNREEQ